MPRFLLFLLAFSFVSLAKASVELNSLDSSSFPFVYVNVTVTDADGNPITDLDEEDFEVLENGVDQTSSEYYSVYSPESESSVRLTDVVFVIDDSGSLKDEQEQVRDNLNNFITGLEDSGVDFQLGLMQYGQRENTGKPQIKLFNGSQFTNSGAVFNEELDKFKVNGYKEPALDSLCKVASSYNFRNGSQKMVILVTDEPSNGDKACNLEGAVDSLNQKTITVHTLSNKHAEFYGTGSVADLTGGSYFDVKEDFSPILDEIQKSTTSQYTIRFSSSNPVFDGQDREVLVKIRGQEVILTLSYAPGEAPKISLTEDSNSALFFSGGNLVYKERAYLPTDEIILKVKIEDLFEPFVDEMFFNYRVIGDSTYRSVSLTRESGDASSGVYSVKVPKKAKEEPGFEFYFSATDSLTTVFLPKDTSTPYSIAIVPNFAPEILHSPPLDSEVLLGQNLQIKAEVLDNTDLVSSTKIFFRKKGDLVWTEKNLSKSGNSYSSEIEGKLVGVEGVEYYLYAEDNYGIGSFFFSPENPKLLTPYFAIGEIESCACSEKIFLSFFLRDKSGKDLEKIVLKSDEIFSYLEKVGEKNLKETENFLGNFLNLKGLKSFSFYFLYGDGSISKTFGPVEVEQTSKCEKLEQRAKNLNLPFSSSFGFFGF